jgi:hypothetical protein
MFPNDHSWLNPRVIDAIITAVGVIAIAALCGWALAIGV